MKTKNLNFYFLERIYERCAEPALAVWRVVFSPDVRKVSAFPDQYAYFIVPGEPEASASEVAGNEMGSSHRLQEEQKPPPSSCKAADCADENLNRLTVDHRSSGCEVVPPC